MGPLTGQRLCRIEKQNQKLVLSSSDATGKILMFDSKLRTENLKIMRGDPGDGLAEQLVLPYKI